VLTATVEVEKSSATAMVRMPKLLMLVCVGLAALSGWFVPAGLAGPPKPLDRSTDPFGDPLPPECLIRIGTIRWQEGGPISALAYSPDGTLVASSGFGRNVSEPSINLWDVASGRPIRRLDGQAGHHLGGAFSPNGRLLAAVNGDGTIRVWNVATGIECRRFRIAQDSSWGNNVAFAPDGKTLASGTLEGPICFLDLESGKERLRLRGHEGPVFDVVFSPDGKLLISSGQDQVVRLWDPISGRSLGELTEHHGSLALSPDGKQLALWDSRSITIRIWDLEMKKEGEPLRAGPGIKDLAFSPDSAHLLTCSADDVRLWNLAGRREVVEARKRCRGVSCAAFAPTGKKLATGGTDCRIRIWETATDREFFPAENRHEGPVLSLAIASDGKVLASGSADETVRLWDLAAGRAIRAWNPGNGEVGVVAFWPRHPLLLTGGKRPPLRFWDLQKGKQEQPWSDPNLSYRLGTNVRGLAYSADGNRLLVTNQWCYVLEAPTGRLLRDLSHGEGVPALSPDGCNVATINVPKGRPLPPALVAKLARAGCCGPFEIEDPEPPLALWNVALGARVHRLQGPKAGAVGHFRFVFSLMGRGSP
jgi:WD40 repeat protein